MTNTILAGITLIAVGGVIGWLLGARHTAVSLVRTAKAGRSPCARAMFHALSLSSENDR